ncbi:type VI secretion system membrane subunit TssM [Arcobacter sp. LA11]|uniref:type VI secretion system membrane subunit TssM n=1 Tax=Arcobacter sp. LA11 TaxID=1898176 RepID=UPI0009320D3F|nr:type VI secretion system membrane subunit TssM [Arcobacter sp. LA11]
MKKPIFKSLNFWLLSIALILSLLVIFVTPFFFKSFEELNFRLLISFSIFFGTVIIILLVLLFKKEETQDILKEKKEQRELQEEHKKVIAEKIKELKTKFSEAIKVIKKSSLYKSKRKAKYELPWYLVVGNNSEGKTTLLESSGLDFPLNVNYDNRVVVEEDSTKSFQWYFAEHSVFIDMPGNYIELKQNPEDPVIWKSFLNLFTKKRWRRPINGIILTISVDTLVDKTEKELEQYGKDLRDRFDELSKSFMSSIPIYLIITKSDKIEGFNEYFSNLTEEEKNEILGITFDHENTNIDTTIVKPQLEDLLKRLNSSVLDRMHYEWEEEYRTKIFMFCENFSELFEKTNLFVDICFAQTRYRKPLMLRGIYFTSVPCEDNHHALVPEDKLEVSRNTKGLFIKRLLNDIIFPEAEIIKMDDNYKKKIKRNQVISYSLSFLIVLFFSIFIVRDFIIHNDILNKLENSYQIYNNKKSKVLPEDDFSHILEVLNDLEKIKQYNAKNTTDDFWKLLFYKTEDRKTKIQEIYYDDLKTLLLPRVANHIEKKMRLNLNSFDKTWDNTKAYVMLENLKRRDSEYLSNYMAEDWAKIFPNTPVIQKGLNYHWKNILEYGFEPYELNKSTLKIARNRLTKLGSEALTYRGLKNKAEQMNLKDFSFSHVLGSNISSFKGNDYVIPGFFTKTGYSIMIKDGRNLTKEILLNNWVIGKRTDLSVVEINNNYKKVLSFYFADYKKYWNTALTKLRIPSQNRISSLTNQLSILSSADSPIISVLRALKEHTNLYSPAEQFKMKSKKDSKITNAVVATVAPGQIGRAVAKKALSSVDKTVDNTSIKNLRNFFKEYNSLLDENEQPSNILKNAVNKLNKTYQTMTSINGAVTPKYDSFKIVTDRISGKTRPMVVPLNSLPIHVKKWYRQILITNWRLILKYAKSYVNIKYKEDVLSFYNERIKNKYPIANKEANNYIKLEDFSDFFKKDGILDTFHKNYISNFVRIQANANAYNLKNIDGNMMNIQKSYMQAILNAHKLKKVFFKNNGSLGFVASIKPHVLGSNLATMELSYDDDNILYEHGPIKSKKIIWPAQSLNTVVKFNLYDLTNNPVVENYLDNEWALFKLLDKFNKQSSSADSVILKYDQDEYSGSFYLKGSITRILKKYNALSNFYLSENL